MEQTARISSAEKLAEAVNAVIQSVCKIVRIGMQPPGELDRFVAVPAFLAASVCSTGPDGVQFFAWQGEAESDDLGLAVSELLEEKQNEVTNLVETVVRRSARCCRCGRVKQTLTKHRLLLVDCRDESLFGAGFLGG